MSKIKQNLQKLYKNHGALTFMLAFYPLLPNMVELHTKGYLKLTKALTGSVSDIEGVIKMMFGERGLKIYIEYKKNNPNQVLPSEIFKTMFENHDKAKVEKLMMTMFFDKAQRDFIHADKMRASVIFALPDMLREVPKDNDADFRTKLISIVSNQAVIDQALPSQLAFIEVALRLLTQIERHKKNVEKDKLNAIFASIEAKIKSELAGNSSAFTAPLRPYVDKKMDPIILSEENAHNVHEVLLLLAVSPAFEVREDAKKAILEINRIRNEDNILK